MADIASGFCRNLTRITDIEPAEAGGGIKGNQIDRSA